MEGGGGGTHRFDGREMDEERTMRKTIARSSNRPTDRPISPDPNRKYIVETKARREEERGCLIALERGEASSSRGRTAEEVEVTEREKERERERDSKVGLGSLAILGLG